MAATDSQSRLGQEARLVDDGITPSAPAGRGRLQETVQSIGSLAKDPKAAYSLAALFALASPFGFASPEQAAAEAAAKLQRQQQAAKAAQAASSHGSSSLAARLVANAKAQSVRRATAASTLRAVPPFWQLAGFAALFATGGYIIDHGDALNGSGVVSAWSITFLLFRTLPTLKLLPRSPLALALSTSVATLGLGVHGCHYFDQTSWRGAVPGLSTELGQQSAAAAAAGAQRGGFGGPPSRPATPQHSLLSSWKEEGVRAVQKVEDRAEDLAQHTADRTRSLLGAPPPTLARNNDEARALAYARRETKARESI
ncbi:uncharacterized protein PFL1_06411 [Pseudozyma flocculosa PF-1]|uniref:Uncharacterized protein n=2 Tax=Pseudozyma flocculosa TaxID=84751 RepID=A0A5C3EWB9_9BASI|nr:uncharacterized protein PFL1_06411 [Pseudozyma flocculosa PF-1]EPQ25955.1 hypothetical protein PFL1_06411 [Pseudozyma flocculosa PF-1]SPO35747.1 uncharacterized protein PSFLO_01218 [Pseudozyma flocculosa]